MAGLPQLDRAATRRHVLDARSALRELLFDAETALLDTSSMRRAREVLASKRAKRALREKQRKPPK